MMLSWKLQCMKMRTMTFQGSVRILTCVLKHLSTGRVFLQTYPTIPIMKTSINNCKPFMVDSSTSTSSNGFENHNLKKKKGFLPYVLSQDFILHVQTLEASRNMCFRMQELIWTQEKLMCFQSVARRRSSWITTGSLWINTYTKSAMKVVIKIVLFGKILLFYLSLSLSNRPQFPPRILIIGWWSSN